MTLDAIIIVKSMNSQNMKMHANVSIHAVITLPSSPSKDFQQAGVFWC